jgi:hypothetical protein
MAAEIRLDVALVHYPVVNRKNEIIGSAVTNLDLHDIARAGRTFGVNTYWVVTPYRRQQELARQITDHWTEGYGGTANPDRAGALSLIRIQPGLDGVIAAMSEAGGTPPLVIATSADRCTNSMTYAGLQRELKRGTHVLLLFGTAWGLAPELVQKVNAVLPPIQGVGEFNHLSVRSAVSIILDRLLGNREGEYTL